MLNKQTLGVGSVACLLAFLLGLAFSFGGKSASVDQLSSDVRDMRNDIKVLTVTINKQNGESHDAITGMQFAIQALQKECDDLKTKEEYWEAATQPMSPPHKR